MAEKMLSEEIEDVLFPSNSPGESPKAEESAEVASESESSPVEEPEANEPVEIPADPETLAKRLGIDVSEVYKTLKVPRGGGREPMTLGELKDLEANADEVQRMRVQYEDEQNKFRSERLKFTQELQVLGGALQQAAQSGQPLSDELVQKAQQAWQAEVEQQNALAREIAPELADDATIEKIEAAAAKVGAPKGFMQSGLPAWLQVRLARLSQLERRLEMAQAKQVKPTKTPSKAAPGKVKPTKAQLEERVRGSSDTEFAETVGSLLFGK